MAVFRWRHFAGEIILWAVRWYCRYGISYRELEEMMGERGVAVDHTTLSRWTQRYAPELEKRSAWYRRRLSFSWRVDETYVRVKGCWKYLYRAIDKDGATLDFYLADRRNTKAAKRFLSAALKRSRDWIPRVINTDKNPAYGEAIAELKKEGAAAESSAPTGQVSQQPAGGRPWQAQAPDPTDARLPVDADGRATIKGFEVMRMFRKGQFSPVDRRDLRGNRGALHPPPVRPLCVSHRRDQAFTRRDRIFATEPDAAMGKRTFLIQPELMWLDE